MAYIGLLGMVIFISMFVAGYQLMSNSHLKKEIRELKGED